MSWHSQRALPEPVEPLMLIDTPDVRQATNYDCGDAAVDVALRVLGVRSTAAVLLADAIDSTHPASIKSAFLRAGLPVVAGQMRECDLQHFTRTGRPVLCPVSLHGGHWVVVRGVGRGRVYYHCSLNGRESVKLSAWAGIWRDTTGDGEHFDRWGIVVG